MLSKPKAPGKFVEALGLQSKSKTILREKKIHDPAEVHTIAWHLGGLEKGLKVLSTY